MLFFDPSHLHTEMARLHDHTHPSGLQMLFKQRRNLPGKSLLHLQAARKHFYQPRDFGEAYNFSGRYVPDVALSEEGEHVVFAHGKKFNVSDNNHIVRFLIEQRTFDDLLRILSVSAGQKLPRL